MPPTAIKAQALADFIAEFNSPWEEEGEPEQLEIWTVNIDGSSTKEMGGAGISSSHHEKDKFEYAIQLRFRATNNEAEYEALLAGLKLSKKMWNSSRFQGKKAFICGSGNKPVQGGSFSCQALNLLDVCEVDTHPHLVIALGFLTMKTLYPAIRVTNSLMKLPSTTYVLRMTLRVLYWRRLESRFLTGCMEGDTLSFDTITSVLIPGMSSLTPGESSVAFFPQEITIESVFLTWHCTGTAILVLLFSLPSVSVISSLAMAWSPEVHFAYTMQSLADLENDEVTARRRLE
uniref:RNase H type-1 domain-containing protein n=1 Tax=Fagus sylvatica TaxID=28930 RepID=A0A2N9IRV9_FAGSY